MNRDDIVEILRDSWNGGSYNDCADDIIDYIYNNSFVFIIQDPVNKYRSLSYHNTYNSAKQEIARLISLNPKKLVITTQKMY